MTYKFTSGSIQINIQKLARIQHHYGQLILHDPPPQDEELYKNEEILIHDNLVAPLLREVDNMAKGDVFPTIAAEIKQPFEGIDVFRPVPALVTKDTPLPRADQVEDLHFDPNVTRFSSVNAVTNPEPEYDPDEKYEYPEEETPDQEDEEPIDEEDLKAMPKDKKIRLKRTMEDLEDPQNFSLLPRKPVPETQSEELPSPSQIMTPEEHIPGKGLLPIEEKPRETFQTSETKPENFDPRADYIISALTARNGELVTATKMITNHPYLFFRLPSSAYHSLPYKLLVYSEPYFAAFDEVLQHEALWKGDHQEVVHKMLEWMLAFPRELEKKGLHSAVRLVLAGVGPEISTMSTGAMLQILGRDECLVRMEELKDVLLSLEKPTDKEGGRVEWWFEEGYNLAGKEAW